MDLGEYRDINLITLKQLFKQLHPRENMLLVLAKVCNKGLEDCMSIGHSKLPGIIQGLWI